jgi:hypothetical protein
MDYLRGFTILLVVVFHLTLNYTKFNSVFVNNPVPEEYNLLFMAISFLINGTSLNCIMFFIAGFFAFGTYKRKGCLSFIKDKLKRLGLPYLGGLIILAPLTQYIVDHSWGKTDNFFDYFLKEFFLPQTITPGHLWFIGMLLIFFLVSMPVFEVLKNGTIKSQHKKHKQISSIILFLIITFLLYWSMNFLYKPYAFISIYILDFPPALLPLYMSYFVFGVYASFQKWFMDNEHKERIYPWAIIYLASLIFSMGMFVIMPDVAEKNNPLMAVFYTVSILSGVLLSLTIFKRFINKSLKYFSWFSGNSYGAYIFHYSIVFFTVYLTRGLHLPIMIKFIVQCIFCPCVIWALSASLKKFTPLRNIL